MTPKKEDYLKIIFELGGKTSKISNKQVAVSLNVAAGSVTEMVNKLAKDGLIIHAPYAGISLTEEGVKVAEALIRRHRIWETFLVEKLGYKLADVHKDAEVLEHTVSEELIDRLEDFLGHPQKCPHGSVIPSKDGVYPEDSHVVLNDLKPGQSAEVEHFIDNHDLLEYLADVKLNIGDQVEILEKLPFEGPLNVKVLNTGEEISIGYKAAHYIFVK
ncbi:metal-dependent transcriptional regulator [Ligilactobacillus equi]|nr:metal-dependent transcriptional regulator [Ligilactobacillus equi]KRL78694.1 Iron-dependent repressor [Ligilactobacillus equi DSM 15833 = JCM 10991]MCQ2556921.1 metal-dependent transcriptional regulator [Ligilactobacillus sp.]